MPTPPAQDAIPFAERLLPAPVEGGFRMDETHWVWCGSAATADGPGPRDGRPGFNFASNTWVMTIPLRSVT